MWMYNFVFSLILAINLTYGSGAGPASKSEAPASVPGAVVKRSNILGFELKQADKKARSN
jgi:hypothetical protein